MHSKQDNFPFQTEIQEGMGKEGFNLIEIHLSVVSNVLQRGQEHIDNSIFSINLLGTGFHS